jgi:hypothetical protein
LGITEHLRDGLEGATEEILAELLKTGAGDGGAKVDTLKQAVDLDGGLRDRREGSLSTLACGTETPHGSTVEGEIYEPNISTIRNIGQ